MADKWIEKMNERKRESDYKKSLKRDSKGKLLNHIENYNLYFMESDKYKSKLKYNDFLQQKEYEGKEWRDFNDAKACVDIETDLDLASADKTKRALEYIFGINTYNPIQDYLNGLEWDGKKRIEEIFIKCFEVNDTNLVRTLSKKWFIAAVKRVFEPGCQFDNMIVLQGMTGIGKTTFCRLLAKDFYSEIKFDEIGNKDIVDKLNKSWIVIIDEMDNFGTKAMASIKSFLSVKKDVVRLAYARNTETYYRHCIFIGSLNDETFLRDITSSTERRFWVFKCNKTNMDNAISKLLTPEMVDQLWAEAVYYYKENPEQYLDVEYDLQKEFADDQRQYKTFTDDIYVDYIRDILDKEYVLVDGEFNDNNDFLNQYNGSTMVCGNKSHINKIPMSSLVYVLKNVYKEEKKTKFIAQAIGNEWEYKVIWYHGKSYKGLYRKEQNNDIISSINGDLPI